MKIQTKLMLYIGGAAAFITLVVLSLASVRLNSILLQIDEQNSKLNFEYMACNAEAVAALENSLANMAFDRTLSNLRYIADRQSSLPHAKNAMKDALRNNDLLSAAFYIGRKPLSDASADSPECELSGASFKRANNAIVETPFSFKTDVSKLGALNFKSSTPLLFAVDAPEIAGGKALFAAISLPPQEGYESLFVAYSITPDLRLKAVSPRVKGISSATEQALYALCDANGGILVSVASEPGFQAPKSIFDLVPGALASAEGRQPSQIRPSKLTLSFRSGHFAELAPQGENVPWILADTPLIVELQNGDKARLVKLFPYPKQYSDTDIARNAKTNLDDLIMTVSFTALFGLALFFPSLFVIARGMSEPLKSAVSFSNALAKGEFPPNFPKMAGSSEIAELGRSLCHMRDRLSNTISKLKKSHEREMQARKDAEAANHLKSDFLANMSLELRNPLNSIMGFSTLILKDIEKGQYDDALKSKATAIFESAESLNGLVATLLDLSKLDTANIETHPTEFETAALMRELVESAVQAASDRGVTIENHFSPNAPVSVCADRDLLAHTLGLLAASLIRSSPGGKKISFGCFVANNRVLFRIKDQKEPRESDSLAAMYLRYASSQTELLPTFAGTTLLNLTIAKNQAHILGADFEVESNDEDSNSCFSLSFLKNEVLPASGMETSSVHMASNWRSSSLPAGSPTDLYPSQKRQRRRPDVPVKILMAEDNEANRLLVEMMLKDGNCDLEAVPDGEACLNLLTSKKYDLLLLDLHMPRLDGYSVLSRIRSDRALDGMPVVVLTAYLEEGDKEKLVQMGANKCILKPINIDELLNTIRALTA